ncbi:MAG TPA: hypothetical protein VGE98_03495 [Thermoanaerobaculia bacterium]
MDYKTFPCPSCGEIIDTTMQVCRYCSAAIDPAQGAQAAALQEQVQKACGRASSLQITARTSGIFALIYLLPFLSGIGVVGLAVTLAVVPVGVLSWRSLYGKLPSADPDLVRARASIREATVIWCVLLVVVAMWLTIRLSVR